MSEDHVFRALADAIRRRLLDRLHREGGLTLGELCQGFEISRQAVTKHLSLLEKANLIATRRQGREKLHFINPVPIHDIAERWIGKFDRPHLQALSDLKRGLEGGEHERERNMNSEIMTKFVYVIFIRTSPETLWSALTAPEFTRQYWFGMEHRSDWQAGSPWQLVFPDGRIADSGEILDADPPRRLVLRWRNEFRPELTSEGHSRCTIELEPVGGTVKLTVAHEIDFSGSKFIEAVSQGWPAILSNLKSLLETGAIALS